MDQALLAQLEGGAAGVDDPAGEVDARPEWVDARNLAILPAGEAVLVVDARPRDGDQDVTLTEIGQGQGA